MTRMFRIGCTVLAWTVIIAQYIIMLRSGEHGGFGATSLIFFGYFTILTNILAALAFSVPLYKDGSWLKEFFNRQSVRAAIALYIFVVAVVYYAVLAQDHNPEGWSAILNVFLHFVLPVLFIVDWLLLTPKHSMSFKSLPLWVVFPVVYGLFNLGRGAITGFYPYPFLNVAELGFGPVMLNMHGFALFYAFGGAVFIGLGRFLGRRAETATAP